MATLGAQVAVAVMMAVVSIRASQAAERCEPAVARIVSIQGLVEVQPAGAADWVIAALDDRLCFGDTIRVGESARAALALANDSVLRFDQRTTLRLAGEVETGRSLLDLLFGDVHFFSHRPRALEVDTPIFNAAAEGTEFLIRARPERAEIIMLDGVVRLRNPQGELLVASGDAAVAVAGEAPRREVVARPRDAVAWALYYPPVLAPLAAREAPLALPPGVQRAVERVAANDHAGALAALEAVPEAARDARYHTYRAGVLLNVGRVEEAAAALERALALDPEAAAVLAQRAIIAVVQNRREAALADARRAVELAPDSAPARIALSYALQAAFQLEEARAVLREAAERGPDDPLVFARLAELELSFGDLDAAQEAAEQAVALAPGLARTQMVLGFAALTRIDIERAKAAFARAIELDSAEPLARLGLGLATIRQGDLEEGRRELEIAAALDPNSSLLRSYLGKAYFEERRDPLDAEQFRIAKELDPNDPTPWFYDAIRLQTENRPVEALRNLERSIALNDNRAPYRSRLLLDEDRATRGVSLARIYDDLGFDQVALVEAIKSLSQDPANHSAHRFLSDTYARLPRHEIARASELLQAQLLQPINLNPVQPSLTVTDLNVVTGIGPAAGFNEYTPLFERNRAQLTATGLIGNNETLADEVAISGLYNRFSMSVGQFHSETDGFRDNNDVDNDLYNLLGQVAITPKLNVQAEYRHRDTDRGDLELNFDPDEFANNDRRELKEDTLRAGFRASPSPRSDLLGSIIFTDLRDDQPSPDFASELKDEGYQLETQYIHAGRFFNIVTGLGRYDVDVQERNIIPDFNIDDSFRFSRKQNNAYFYTNIDVSRSLRFTAGLSYDDLDQEPFDNTELNPKVGIRWQPFSAITLRAAAFRTLTRALIVDQTIEPTNIAGFNQFFDDGSGVKTTQYGAGLDVHPIDNLYFGIEAFRRDLDFPIAFGLDATRLEDRQEDQIRSYLYYVLHPQWSVNFEIRVEEFETHGAFAPDVPADLDTIRLPVSVNYFHPSGLFAQVAETVVYQDLDRRAVSTQPSGSNSFFLLDAAVGYRLPERRGIITLEARNLLDEKFSFQDDNFQNPSITRISPFIPDRMILGRLTLSF